MSHHMWGDTLHLLDKRNQCVIIWKISIRDCENEESGRIGKELVRIYAEVHPHLWNLASVRMILFQTVRSVNFR